MVERRRVVVTGIGVVSPAGIGKEKFWEGVSRGKNCIDRITFFDPKDHPSQVAAEIRDFDPTDYLSPQELHHVHRSTPLAIAATAEALRGSKISESDYREIGVVIGSGAGGLGYGEQQIMKYYRDGYKRMSPHASTGTFVGMISSDVSIRFGLNGMSTVVSTGCTSANDAMGSALNLIRFGLADILITGGAEACVTPAIVAAFARLGALSIKWNAEPKRASRPFNADRDGFVMGEGAWIFVFEELKRALKRGAVIYAEVAGYAATCDAYHKTVPEPTGAFLAKAMENAMKDAALAKEQIDYINLHGTSTILNDKTETAAIKLCFGRRAYSIPCSSLKSMIGHPQGASGAAGAAASIMSMINNFIVPTINYERPDPECDLDYVPNKGRAAKVDTVMVNSIGFGSKNSIIILKKYS
ncbi:MAG: beta-ketoacyl-ACP synthase II [Candidatus Saganbacteria bacterium]|nr:beta-ketoacyl-ACP synthase II [Candidatus Saganbacteria bacterium]